MPNIQGFLMVLQLPTFVCYPTLLLLQYLVVLKVYFYLMTICFTYQTSWTKYKWV